ncbi:MAG TPA: hypothetical protein VMG80_07100 [Solirubrobacteraceae bacterium]|nr:hypothetical protein [Solirubrobacteraceae bacterium]
MAGKGRLRRISIGFQGGQVLALRVSESELESLNKALAAGGWHDLASEDGVVRLHLGQVVYVRAEDEDQRVGFGA